MAPKWNSDCGVRPPQQPNWSPDLWPRAHLSACLATSAMPVPRPHPRKGTRTQAFCTGSVAAQLSSRSPQSLTPGTTSLSAFWVDNLRPPLLPTRRAELQPAAVVLSHFQALLSGRRLLPAGPPARSFPLSRIVLWAVLLLWGSYSTVTIPFRSHVCPGKAWQGPSPA